MSVSGPRRVPTAHASRTTSEYALILASASNLTDGLTPDPNCFGSGNVRSIQQLGENPPSFAAMAAPRWNCRTLLPAGNRESALGNATRKRPDYGNVKAEDLARAPLRPACRNERRLRTITRSQSVRRNTIAVGEPIFCEPRS